MDATFDATLPRWDLSSFYGTLGDPIEQQITSPQIAHDLAEAQGYANALSTQFRSKEEVARLDGDALAAAIAQYEKVDDLVSKVGFFFRNAKSIHLQNEAVSKAAKHADQRSSEIMAQLVPFVSALTTLDTQALDLKLAGSEALRRYMPWLKKLREMRPYQLSDAREAELLQTAYERHDQYIDAFDEALGALRFPMPNRLLSEMHRNKYHADDPDGRTDLTLTEWRRYAADPSPEARKEAYETGRQVMLAHADRFAELTNIVAGIKARDDAERGFAHPMDASNLTNQMEAEVIDAMVGRVRARFGDTCQRYLKLKAGMLGSPGGILDPCDTAAPSPYASDRKIPWTEAKRIVLDAVRDFSPDMAKAGQEFFDNGWIDAEPRAGKSGGACCEGASHSAHPTIHLNYQFRTKDVITLAHELGHGINAVLQKRAHSQLMADIDKSSAPLSEVPSTFVENLVFDALLKHAKDDHERIALLIDKLDGLTALISRQIAYHVYETHLHEAAKAGTPLNAATLNRLWMNACEEQFGDAVHTEALNPAGWSVVGHFLHMPFYVHAYSFAGLMSDNLHHQMKKGAVPDFPEKMIDFYANLGVRHHSELMQPFGLDARDPRFWDEGLDQFKGYIDQLEALLAKTKARDASATPGTRVEEPAAMALHRPIGQTEETGSAKTGGSGRS